MPRRLVEPRLIGTWQSDRRRTFRNWKPRPGVSPAAYRKFKGIFGKLIVRWDETHVHTYFDGEASEVVTEPYRVVARDKDSVVIRGYDSLSEAYQLRHIFFEEGFYVLTSSLIGPFLEYFRRID